MKGRGGSIYIYIYNLIFVDRTSALGGDWKHLVFSTLLGENDHQVGLTLPAGQVLNTIDKSLLFLQ